MTNLSASLLPGPTLAYKKEEAMKLDHQAVATLPRPLPDEMLRIANRLALSLGAKESVIAVTGVSKLDPTAKLAKSLALALVQLGYGAVLYVDAEGSDPARAGEGSLPGLGLAPLLGGALAAPAPRTGGPGLDVLTIARKDFVTPQVVASEQMAHLLESLRSYRFVILNVGSVLSSTESMLMAAKADAIVAVAATGERTKREVNALRLELSLLKARFIGIVLASMA